MTEKTNIQTNAMTEKAEYLNIYRKQKSFKYIRITYTFIISSSYIKTFNSLQKCMSITKLWNIFTDI